MRHPKAIARATGALLIVIVFLLPVLYIVMIAFEPPAHFLRSPLTPPAMPAVSNFRQAWTGANLAQELVNTVIYAVIAAAISTALSILIAFPIARRLVRGSSALYGMIAIGLFLPLAIIPLFIEARMLGLYNDRIGYILLHVEPSLPLGVVLLTAFISAIPAEIDEAAWMDGAGYLRYLSRAWCR